jgi:hypothetical protein
VALKKGCTNVGAFSDLCHLRMDVELAAEMLGFSCTLCATNIKWPEISYVLLLE